MSNNVIRDFWILSKSGLTIYHHQFTKQLDEQIIGGFLFAIEKFGEKIAQSELKSFEFKSIKFILIKEKDILFIANYAKHVKDEKIIDELKRVSNIFFKSYSNIIDNWNGDLNVFADFEEKIRDSLEKRFEDTFW
ncbi:MAG TPA: hypothetical protein VGB37_06015 [Candidatus Lokiarchaeia archaeon]